ncbi:MAG: 30S ribosomal protein S3 [Candidatus Nanoarchaeia archaeon]
MIERSIVNEKLKEFRIQEFIMNSLRNLGHSHVKLQRTPLGDKISIYAARPGLIVGRKGQNIKKLTLALKKNFEFENPQIEINEVLDVNIDARVVAEKIASSLEKYGSARFKGIGHRVLADAIRSGALGAEIVISGKIPSSRARRWRFYQGYLKKCGDIALTGVNIAYASAFMKTGKVGIQVRIMPPDTKLPDDIRLLDTPIEIVESEEIEEEKPKKATKKTKKKASAKKSPVKKKAKKVEKASVNEVVKPVEKTEPKDAPKAGPETKE